MYAIKAIYDGMDFKPMQPIPVKEGYEVIITFTEPLVKSQAGILDYFNNWGDENLIDLAEIMADRENFSLGRCLYEDIP